MNSWDHGQSFPGDNLDHVRLVALFPVVAGFSVCAVCLFLYSILFQDTREFSTSYLSGILSIAGFTGFIGGLIYIPNFIGVCIWTTQAERDFKVKQELWIAKQNLNNDFDEELDNEEDDEYEEEYEDDEDYEEEEVVEYEHKRVY